MPETASTASTTASNPAASSEDAARRQRQQMEQLLGTPPFTADGRVTASRGTIDYRVVAEFMPARTAGLDGPSGEPEAAVFTTAYLARTDEAGAPRPVCFAFNGGPGSASLWLHLGALGPKRVVVPDDGTMPAPPYAVADNPLTWLQHFDLVFVDPPHTGWSVSAGPDARRKLLSVDGDAAALADVIIGWLTRHRRFGSALYLAGESYGTTRAAAMADLLQGSGVALSGLVLVSCALDLGTLRFAPGHVLPHVLFLPGMAHVAQYHGCLRGPVGASPQAAREAAEAFAADEYPRALLAGHRLSTAAQARCARRLAELTGLPRALVEQSNLRITDQVFFSELLRDRGLIVGRLDARSTAPMGALRAREGDFDPGIEAIAAPFTMAAMGWFAELAGSPPAGRYEVLSLEVNKQWDWTRRDTVGWSRMGYANTCPDLARALRRNPHLRVLMASGRSDLGTPYSASDYTLAQLDVPPDVVRRVTHRHYDAGHMMYTRQADLQQLEADLAAWLAA